MEYKIEKRYCFNGGLKVKYVVVGMQKYTECGRGLCNYPLCKDIEELNSYEEAEQYIINLNTHC